MSRRKPNRRAAVPSASRWRAAAAATALLAATAVAYVPATGAEFIWDDDDYVTDNANLRSASGLRRIWLEPGAVPQYYPLVFSTFWLEYQLWGEQAAGYHVVNIALHGFNAILLWRLLLILSVPGAWVAAAVFALHPVHVESVAWITERKNVLSGLFYLGALLAYLRSSPLEQMPPPVHGRRGWYVVALALFAAALLSKTVTCTLPPVILVLTWWKRGRVRTREVAAAIPFFLLGGALAAATAWMERYHVGAQGTDWSLSLLDRCLLAGRAVWFYAAKLLWPAHLTFIYPRWHIDAASVGAYLYPLAVGAAILALYGLRSRLGRGPLAAVLFFVLTLGPALGFVDFFPMRYSFVADHFQYLASIGLIAVVIGALAERYHRGAGLVRAAGPVAAAVLLIVLLALTREQTRVYLNLETLWRDTLEKNPTAWMAHNNLGLLRYQQGRVDEAITHYLRALQIKANDAYALNNLGNALAAKGRMDEATERFRQALGIEPGNAEARNNLGNALAAQGRFEEAQREYTAALHLKPSYAEAYNNLGNVLAAQGAADAAIAQYRLALKHDPTYAAAHHNLGVLLLHQGSSGDAVVHFREALRSDPAYADAHRSLGLALAGEGRADEAEAHLADAVRLNPADAASRDVLRSLRQRHAPQR